MSRLPIIFTGLGRRAALIAAAFASATFGIASDSSAESLSEALSLAYAGNPTLNASRAAFRSASERIGIAQAGLHPTVSAGVSGSKTDNSSLPASSGQYGFGFTLSQPVFDSFKTSNSVAAARQGVEASRENLRSSVQDVLLQAATAYMDVIRDRAIAGFREQSLEFLNELVRSERARLEVGESTITDVAQAEARRSSAEAFLASALAQIEASEATYRQVIGKPPGELTVPEGIDSLLPGSVESAKSLAMRNHPALLASLRMAERASFEFEASKADILPNLSLNAEFQRGVSQSGSNSNLGNSASITARFTVPLYHGAASAGIRQGREALAEARISTDATADGIRAGSVAAFSRRHSARAAMKANQAQLEAANIALEAISREREVGQRTTLDVLQTQDSVINAQIDLASSSRDMVVSSYALLAAVGGLDAERLGLKVEGK